MGWVLEHGEHGAINETAMRAEGSWSETPIWEIAYALRPRRSGVPAVENYSAKKRFGISQGFKDSLSGLIGRFRIFDGASGDVFLEESATAFAEVRPAVFSPWW